LNKSVEGLLGFLPLLTVGMIACTTATPDEDQGAPCNDIGQCLPGWICAQGQCVEGTTGNQGPNSVGPNGGVVKGPNGSQIEVPTGALAAYVELTFATHSENLPISDLEVLAPLVEVGPDTTDLSLEATIIVPVDTSSSALTASDIAIYRAESIEGPWEKLFGASSSTLAIGLTNKLGIFMAATPKN
jgi:hypothetical protein